VLTIYHSQTDLKVYPVVSFPAIQVAALLQLDDIHRVHLGHGPFLQCTRKSERETLTKKITWDI